MLPYRARRLDGDCDQTQTPGTDALMNCESVPLLVRAISRPETTSSATVNARCAVPTALPVTTTRSSVSLARETSVSATTRCFRDGARTIWSLPITTGSADV